MTKIGQQEERAKNYGQETSRCWGFPNLATCEKAKSFKNLYKLLKGPGSWPGKFLQKLHHS